MRIVKSARLQKPNMERNAMNGNVIDIIERFQAHHALREERARWTWVSANSDFKVPNEADQTRNSMIVEFNETNDQESSQDRKEI
jgi:hypothetical protein